MNSEFRTFPPGWSNIHVPVNRKRATLAGIATYSPSLPKGIWAQRAAWAAVTIGGPRLLPGRRSNWHPPLPPPEWEHFLAELAGVAGTFDSHTVYERRDSRPGLLMLLLDGERPVGFVRARQDDAAGIERERKALTLAETARVGSFRTPRVLGGGTVAGWFYLVTSPMPPRMHRMLPGAPAPAVLADIATVLAGLDKPPDVAADWEPFHGDFTPWNLRRVDGGTPWLIDWEDSGWAPPDADRVLYVASAYAIGRPVGDERLASSAAVRYWYDEINRRNRRKLDEGVELGRLEYGLLEALAAGREG